MPHLPRGRRWLLMPFGAIIVASGLVMVGMSPAAADVHGQIATARAQLDRLNNQSEAAAERYNAARIRLGAAAQREQAVQESLRRANLVVERQSKALNDFARQSYESGGMSSTLTMLQDGSVANLLGRTSMLAVISQTQQQTLAKYAASRRVQEGAQNRAQALLAQRRTATAAALREKQTIQRNEEQAQELLNSLGEKEAALRAAQAARAFERQSLTPPPAPTPGQVRGNPVGTAIAVARAQLGKPYVYGAAGPNSFDCSGLTMYAYGRAGISLPHYTGSQWNVGRHVSVSELQPGDLVFFNTDAPLGHEGIYLGGNQFIHAPHTGDVVKISALSGYYTQTYAGAVRVVG